jgi:hypothetical protein
MIPVANNTLKKFSAVFIIQSQLWGVGQMISKIPKQMLGFIA